MRYSIASTLLICVLLTACGFKLRGFADIPLWLSPVAIMGEEDKVGIELYPYLKSQLRTNGIQVVSDPGGANHWIIIKKTNLDQQIISVAASTTPRQYQFTYYVQFEVESRKGEIIQKPVDLAISRTVTVNEDRILGSDSETRQILEEVYKDVAIQMINKLAISKTSRLVSQH